MAHLINSIPTKFRTSSLHKLNCMPLNYGKNTIKEKFLNDANGLVQISTKKVNKNEKPLLTQEQAQALRAKFFEI